MQPAKASLAAEAARLTDRAVARALHHRFAIDDRMRQDPRFAGDPQWTDFEAAPGKFGFATEVLRDAGVVIYVKDELLRSRRAAAVGIR